MLFSALSMTCRPCVLSMHRGPLSSVKTSPGLVSLLALAAILMLPMSSSGEPVPAVNPPLSYIVTTSADDTSGVAGNCPAGGPNGGNGQNCSLRDAVAAANALPSGSSAAITFVSSLGSTSVPGTITLINGALPLTGSADITITGLGTTALIIDGNNNGNILQVQTGVTASVSNLTMQSAVGTPSQLGGAIVNEGTLTLTGVIVQNSQANLHGVSGGGGIYNGATSTLTILNSTIYNNSTSYFGGSSGYGGGILNEGGNVSITSSTLAANSASLGGGNIYTVGGTVSVDNSTITESNSTTTGGGISGGGTITVVNSTIAGNRAGSYPGVFASGTVTVTNSIVAGNISYITPTGNCVGCILDGNNIVDEDPQLSVLGSYGGVTQTLVPLPGSPAICTGAPTADKNDQRGYDRPNDSCYDIGAVQTKYAIAFVQQPTNTLVNTTITPAVTVTTLDHGSGIPGATVNLTLNGAGTLSGILSRITDTAGTATFAGLAINSIGLNDTLTASATTALTVTSNPFDVTGDVPTVSFIPNPSVQTYGTAIAASSLNAIATYNGNTVAGTFSYVTTVNGSLRTLIAGSTVLPAGSYSIDATFTPADATTYTSASANALYTINQGTPTITWAPVTTVSYGTSLGAFLNATASYNGSGLAGIFTYTAQPGGGSAAPVTGSTVLTPGGYTLTASFNPSDTTDYKTASASSQITVTQATQTITFPALISPVTYGVSPITLSATASSNLPVSYTVTGPAR